MSDVIEKDAVERRDEAIDLLEKHAHHNDSDHQRWLIDQMARTLLGDEYEQWVEAYEKNGKAIAVRKWMTGKAPKPDEHREPNQIHAFDPDVPLILKGDIWINRGSGKEVVIRHTPRSPMENVEIRHSSGRVTKKQQHYFVYDYQKKDNGNV